MPFGIDSEQVKKVVEDVATIKAQQLEILAKLAEILSRLPEKSVSA